MLTSLRLLATAVALVVSGFATACSTTGGAGSIPEPADTDGEPTTTESTEGTTTTTESEETNRGSRDEVIDEIANEFLTQPDLPIETAEEAECLATEFLDMIGDDWEEFLEEADDDLVLEEEQAMSFARAFRGCGIPIEDALAESMVEDGATEDEAGCVIDAFGIDNIERLLAFGMMGTDPDDLDAELGAELETAIRGCI